MHYCKDVIQIFNHCFLASHHTMLISGGEEPIYLPANEHQPYHAIVFTRDYFSSALHEVAHWLIAGHERRLQEDYGYWYVPDGRNAAEQILFQQVEVKPQALEWILSIAAGVRFQFSIDNLNGETIDISSFKRSVYQQVLIYERQGLPKRAMIFRDALRQFYSLLSLQK